MEVSIVEKQAFTIVGTVLRVKSGQTLGIPKLWDAFMARMSEIRQIAHPGVFYGAMSDWDEATHEFDYLAGVEVSKAEDLPEGLAAWYIPAKRYAVLTCTLPTIMQAIDQVYHKWLPASGYRRGDTPEFELYDEQFDPQDSASPMYVYVPVVKE